MRHDFTDYGWHYTLLDDGDGGVTVLHEGQERRLVGSTYKHFGREILRLAARVRELEERMFNARRGHNKRIAALEAENRDLREEQRVIRPAVEALALRFMAPEEIPGNEISEDLETVGIAADAEMRRLKAENAALRERLDRAEHDFTYLQRRLDGEDEPEQEFPVPGCNCTNCRDAR